MNKRCSSSSSSSSDMNQEGLYVVIISLVHQDWDPSVLQAKRIYFLCIKCINECIYIILSNCLVSLVQFLLLSIFVCADSK